MDSAQESVPHLEWLINQGLAVALLLLFLWASWKGVSWLGTAFLIPLRDAAIAHLQEVGQSLASLGVCLRNLDGKTNEINDRTKRIETELESSRYASGQFQAGKGNFRGTENLRENAKGNA